MVRKTARSVWRALIGTAALAAAAASASAPVWAQDLAAAGLTVPGYVNQTVVERDAMRNARGVMGVNMAAGDFNIQLNGTAIAVSAEDRAKGIAQVNAVQAIGVNIGTAADVAVISVEDGAFARAQGILSLNQASGLANAQANAVSIALGVNVEAVAENELDQAVAMPLRGEWDGGNMGRRAISVADTAFRGASGIVQVNQSAGSGNATANSFALRVQAGVGN